MVGWFGLMAPARTPVDVIAKVNRDANTVVRDPQIAARLLQLGMYDPGGTPEAFGQFIVEERARWASAVKAVGLQPE
jgi:tripartite-type tricarboxylate transporter receptor subunit TctC